MNDSINNNLPELPPSDSPDIIPPDLDQVLGPIGHAFWISLLILLIIYLCKYFGGKKCLSKDFVEILLEVPIDVLTLLLTIIITTFCAKNRMHFGHYLFIVTIIVSFVCAIFRRNALEAYLKDKGTLCFWLLFVEWLIGCVWIIYVYITIT